MQLLVYIAGVFFTSLSLFKEKKGALNNGLYFTSLSLLKGKKGALKRGLYEIEYSFFTSLSLCLLKALGHNAGELVGQHGWLLISVDIFGALLTSVAISPVRSNMTPSGI